MQRTDWAEVKRRLKEAVDQGVKVLKEGGQGARYVAGQTAHVLQLEMDIYALKNRITKAQADLGEAVHKSLKAGKIQTNSEIQRLIGDLDTLKASLKRKQNEVQRTHITPDNGSSKPRRKKTTG